MTLRWVHCVLQVKENTEESQAPVIVCTNQVLSSGEAVVMKANSWLYHYYMVQSRLQYGLAYGAHSPTLGALYYPHMGLQPQYYEQPHPLHSAYLHAAQQLPYSPYTYSPPVGYYHLPDPCLEPKDPAAQGPLDFSKGPGPWETKGKEGEGRAFQHWEAPSPLYRPQDLSNKSPSWRSDSSGSPLEAPYPAFQPR